jgi:hypothetical protein
MGCRVEIVMDCELFLLIVMEGEEHSRKPRKLCLWVLGQSCWFGQEVVVEDAKRKERGRVESSRVESPE